MNICPNCGSELAYDRTNQVWYCGSCNYDVKEYENHPDLPGSPLYDDEPKLSDKTIDFVMENRGVDFADEFDDDDDYLVDDDDLPG